MLKYHIVGLFSFSVQGLDLSSNFSSAFRQRNVASMAPVTTKARWTMGMQADSTSVHVVNLIVVSMCELPRLIKES